jgi:hypothetical protein
MANSNDDRKRPVESSAAKIPEHLVERFAPVSRNPVVVFGGHLLQLVGAIAILFIILHFLEKYW